MGIEAIDRYLTDIQGRKHQWFCDDLECANNRLKSIWTGISSGIYEEDNCQFQEISDTIKILIDQISQYGDRK